jgi:uncharacterized coiled-coil DUF342 family protein
MNIKVKELLQKIGELEAQKKQIEEEIEAIRKKIDKLL